VFKSKADLKPAHATWAISNSIFVCSNLFASVFRLHCLIKSKALKFGFRIFVSIQIDLEKERISRKNTSIKERVEISKHAFISTATQRLVFIYFSKVGSQNNKDLTQQQ
jgi:hypothetical protein